MHENYEDKSYFCLPRAKVKPSLWGTLRFARAREMEIRQNKHGEILGYTQKHPGEEPVDFALDEVVANSFNPGNGCRVACSLPC